ncbi:Glycosyltransferase family 9 (heptosyltransferase) [Paraburkholderia diazotrophica]|uniref:Glycosyltransferase family 9 (Heptosyltransferase) n=1 Tax=Paraburkholderia diazotrophica TaxID=667676 RepID=A0A1H6WMS3_9BURK|nr:Glycosyltransferase family 9 (heptosyltransferase) [Paraburkholderia diazotrophica]
MFRKFIPCTRAQCIAFLANAIFCCRSAYGAQGCKTGTNGDYGAGAMPAPVFARPSSPGLFSTGCSENGRVASFIAADISICKSSLLLRCACNVLLDQCTDPGESNDSSPFPEKRPAPQLLFAGHTLLGGLAALAARARLVICNDTGISHVAAAMHAPGAAIASGSDTQRWAPLDHEQRRVLADYPACRPCRFHDCPMTIPTR